jgi:formylglycine-generating enzyme
VTDPWTNLAALSLALLGQEVLPDGDPGPTTACPDDMRLVEGVHHDQISQLCSEVREGVTKRPVCFAYDEELTALEGKTTAVHVCMDQYEAPNKKGSRPLTMQSYESGTKWCEKRGKRLCSEQEWELACEGPKHLPWAYGWSLNKKLCNSDKAWKQVDFAAFDKGREEGLAESERLWQGTPSGRYKTCVSPFGVFDMIGNLEEWVTTRPSRDKPGALMGGFWSKPWTGCRGTNDAHQATFAFYETGFRCCKDPEKAKPEKAND